MATRKKPKEATVVISAPNLQIAHYEIVGTAPYVGNAFSRRTQEKLIQGMEAGSKSKSRKNREARDFEADWKGAIHVAEDGWYGMPAAAFRSAMIRACTLVNYKMTLAKLAVFIEEDGFDKYDGMPLVKIEGKPERFDAAVRNATGVIDIRARPMWKRWSAKVRVRFDADVFSVDDVTNLMMRVGRQCGLGEGRPFSKNSHGMGWGLFDIKENIKTEVA